MPIRTERNAWPLLIVRWPEGDVLDADLDQYQRESEADLYRGEIHCIMHDSRNALGLSAAQRKSIASHLEEHQDAITRWTAAVAIVTPSALIRGMITAVSWLTGTPCPQKTFATEQEAHAWLVEMYESKTGEPAPFGLQQRHHV